MLVIDDSPDPSHVINFLQPGEDLAHAHGPMAERARHWYGIVKAMIIRKERSDAPSPDLSSELDDSPSVVDQLEKLSQLLDKGLLSREEFEQQKRNLLGDQPGSKP